LRVFALYFGRVVAFILLPVAIFLIVFAVLTRSFLPVLLNPQIVKDGLARQNIYDEVVSLALPAFIDQNPVIAEGFPIEISEVRRSMGDNDWRAIANEIAPPDWTQRQVESVLDALYAYIGGAPNVEYQLETNVLAARLTGGEGERAIRRVVTLARPCSRAQIEQLRAFDPEQITDLPICSPAAEEDAEMLSEYMALVFDDLATEINAQGESISGRFILSNGFELNERITPGEGRGELDIVLPVGEPNDDPLQIDQDLLEFRAVIQTYKQWIPMLYLISAMLLALIVLFGVRSLKGFASWVGWAAVSSGGLLLFIMLLISVGLVEVPAIQPVMPSDVAMPPEFFELQTRIGNGILGAIFVEATPAVLVQSLVLLAVGIVLVFIAVVAPGAQEVLIAVKPAQKSKNDETINLLG
jgi:hypothetical protein